MMMARTQQIDITTVGDGGSPRATAKFPQQVADGKFLILERIACSTDDGTGLALGSAVQWNVQVIRQGSVIGFTSNNRDGFGPSPSGAFDFNQPIRVPSSNEVYIIADGVGVSPETIYVTWQGFFIDENTWDKVQGFATLEG